MMNKTLMMLATTALVGGMFSLPASAISEAYRAQLEKSGCTQVSDANGTCNTHHSKKQNQHAQSQADHRNGPAEPQAAREVARIMDSHIAGKNQGQAVDYMHTGGWRPLNEEETRWEKSGFIAEFDLTSKGKVTGVAVR
ncbi:hypothetical protein [Enterobacter sp. CC120223-11]|uniref:hypothetical protein n=1 Tax=Enterobacter sp. CC120223-11 TaxID=1378073 RepID=UPI000BC4D04F|nr:hypothetical protein [Enterobacter sp. CC120223-11]SNY70019.1 hypothetical protein SAMN02744775_02277 [Enterobacter sp. CC120223-11]